MATGVPRLTSAAALERFADAAYARGFAGPDYVVPDGDDGRGARDDEARGVAARPAMQWFTPAEVRELDTMATALMRELGPREASAFAAGAAEILADHYGSHDRALLEPLSQSLAQRAAARLRPPRRPAGFSLRR